MQYNFVRTKPIFILNYNTGLPSYLDFCQKIVQNRGLQKKCSEALFKNQEIRKWLWQVRGTAQLIMTPLLNFVLSKARIGQANLVKLKLL